MAVDSDVECIGAPEEADSDILQEALRIAGLYPVQELQRLEEVGIGTAVEDSAADAGRCMRRSAVVVEMVVGSDDQDQCNAPNFLVLRMPDSGVVVEQSRVEDSSPAVGCAAGVAVAGGSGRILGPSKEQGVRQRIGDWQ